MASLGSNGVNVNNFQRELFTRFGKKDIVLILSFLEGDSTVKYFVYPHMVFNRSGTIRTLFFTLADSRRAPWTVADGHGNWPPHGIQPHVVFLSEQEPCRLATRPREFERRLGARRDWLRNFWVQLAERPHGQYLFEHCEYIKGKSLEELETTVPLYLHCDAGPIGKDLSAYILSWSSAEPHIHDVEMSCHFPIAVWIKGPRPLSERDANKVWDEFLMSAKSLHSGPGPRMMADGKHFKKGRPTCV